jgi:hypothetical protein
MKNLNRQLGIQVTPIPAYMGGGFLNATGEESALKKKIATAKNEIRSLEKKKADENVKLENEKKKKRRGFAKTTPATAIAAGERLNPIEGAKMMKQAQIGIEQAEAEIRNLDMKIALLNNEIADFEAQLASIVASEPTPSPAPRPTPSPSPSPSPSGAPSPTSGGTPTTSMTESTPLTTSDLTSGGSGKNNTLLYVGIGVVVLGGIAYFVMKK